MLLKKHKKVGLLEHKDMRHDVVITVLVTSFLFFAGPRPSQAEIKTVELKFNHRMLSAMIREAPFREVIAAIEKKGIWFKVWLKGKESVLNEKVSVKFKGPSKRGWSESYLL
jgi:hypothetical protein